MSLEKIIDDYLDYYVFEGDDGCTRPDDDCMFIVKDAVWGLLADEEFRRAYGGRRQRWTKADLGREVLAQHFADQRPVPVVIVKVSDLGIAKVARLRPDGSRMDEGIWTGSWFDVYDPKLL